MGNPDRDPKLNVRVSQSKKEEWLDAVGEDETLKELVVDAVDEKIGNEFIHIDKIEETVDLVRGDGAGFDFSEVNDRLDNLQGAVESLHRELDAVATSGASYDQERVSTVAMDLLDYIPTWATQDIAEQRPITREQDKLAAAKSAIEDDLQHERELEIDGSVSRLAEKSGEPPVLVRQALIYLEQNTTANIGSILVRGTRHWVEL